MNRRSAAAGLLYTSALLVLVGGFYDLFTPAPPPHHLDFLGVAAQEVDSRTAALLSALFRALGGALVAVGVGSLVLINRGVCRGHDWATVALVLLIGVTEGINAVQMYNVGSPYWAPLAFIFFLLSGVAFAYLPSKVFPVA